MRFFDTLLPFRGESLLRLVRFRAPAMTDDLFLSVFTTFIVLVPLSGRPLRSLPPIALCRELMPSCFLLLTESRAGTSDETPGWT